MNKKKWQLGSTFYPPMHLRVTAKGEWIKSRAPTAGLSPRSIYQVLKSDDLPYGDPSSVHPGLPATQFVFVHIRKE